MSCGAAMKTRFSIAEHSIIPWRHIWRMSSSAAYRQSCKLDSVEDMPFIKGGALVSSKGCIELDKHLSWTRESLQKLEWHAPSHTSDAYSWWAGHGEQQKVTNNPGSHNSRNTRQRTSNMPTDDWTKCITWPAKRKAEPNIVPTSFNNTTTTATTASVTNNNIELRNCTVLGGSKMKKKKFYMVVFNALTE